MLIGIIKEHYSGIQKYRKLIQYFFLLILLWIGMDFSMFVHQLETGSPVTAVRPPGVEAFLPISALISLKYWFYTGVINSIHPSALVILLVIIALSLILKKVFCSWVCPFSLLSDHLAMLHQYIFPKGVRTFKWMDYLLRSLKYLLLIFFLWTIFLHMDIKQVELFVYSPYNRVADIKMLKFFSNISGTTMQVLLFLVIISIFVPYFWCRYLCPYGALLGIISLLSPFKINRVNESCTGCKKCTRACPSGIMIHDKKEVFSPECYSCYRCIDGCPEKETLSISLPGRIKIKPVMFAISIVLIFLAGIATAKFTGHWQNSISNDEYRFHIMHMDHPLYYHNRGEVPEYDTNTYNKDGFKIKKISGIKKIY